MMSLYVYGKKGPQEPEPSVSDDRSSECSTCQSNDSAESIGTLSEYSVDLESEISKVPQEVYVSKPITTIDVCAHAINKDPLEDLQNSNEGLFTFGGSKGYITGKGRIRVGNLDFDSVSFVKELGHFNLFSISQICDKHHKVLFTETKCLVVSSDFEMPDENHILLKVPRHHNMYSFDVTPPNGA
ncbi:hypothetical protein Tco_0630188 [Tanacetum coccineum]